MVRIIRKLSVALASAALLLGFAPSPAGAGQQGPVRAAAPPVHGTSEAGNPFVDGWYADPDVAVYDDRFWVYPTTSPQLRRADLSGRVLLDRTWCTGPSTPTS